MKKVIVVCFLFTLVGCSFNEKKTDFNLKKVNDYQALIENHNNLSSLVITTLTESGKMCYQADDKLEEAYQMIKNMTITKETIVTVSDDDTIYSFYLEDGSKVSFTFNGKYYHYDNTNYVVERNNIDIRNLEEIECK